MAGVLVTPHETMRTYSDNSLVDAGGLLAASS